MHTEFIFCKTTKEVAPNQDVSKRIDFKEIRPKDDKYEEDVLKFVHNHFEM